MVVQSVEKCPASFEPYRCTLSDDLVKTAKDQLGEDEALREHSLSQLRDWIAKHPYIRKCRTDASFLLRFLRHRKFSVPKAQESIERYLVVRQRLPKWYQKLDPKDATMKKFLDDQVLTVLGKDDAGRIVVLARMGKFDVDNLTPMHLFRFVTLLTEYLADHDEAVQVAGIRVWIDHSNTTMKYFGLWGITDLKISIESISKMMPYRFQDIRLAELPSAATSVINIGLAMVNPKLKERISFHPTMAETMPHYDEKLWTKDYGGTLDAAELNQKLLEKLEAARDELLALDEMEIDIEHYSALWNLDLSDNGELGGVAGNFRKLEVD